MSNPVEKKLTVKDYEAMLHESNENYLKMCKERDDYEGRLGRLWAFIVVLGIVATIVLSVFLNVGDERILDIYYPEPTCTDGILVQQADGKWKEVNFDDYHRIVVTKRHYLFYATSYDRFPKEYDKDEVIFMGCSE